MLSMRTLLLVLFSDAGGATCHPHVRQCTHCRKLSLRAPHARLNFPPFAYRRKAGVSLLLFLKRIVSKDFWKILWFVKRMCP